MNSIDIEKYDWEIVYARYFFSKPRAEFNSFLSYVRSRILSTILMLAYAIFLALFIMITFGVAPFMIIKYFEGVSAPWAAEPIMHGFKFFLIFSTVVVIPLILITKHSNKPKTKRIMKDIALIYCSITIPLTMLELSNIYPEQWKISTIKEMTSYNWSLFFNAHMLDAITLGTFSHFVNLSSFPNPESLYSKVLMFMMKVYFAFASAWYFYYKIRFRLTGSVRITCSMQEMEDWFLVWAKKNNVDIEKAKIKVIGLHTNVEKVLKPTTYSEFFNISINDISLVNSKDDDIYIAPVYEKPMFVIGYIMIMGAFSISLLSIPVIPQEWADFSMSTLKWVSYVIGALFCIFLVNFMIWFVNKKIKDDKI